MGAEGDFMVKVTKKEVVAAVLPLQEHWLPQSNLDLLLPPLDVSVFFCYKKPPQSEEASFTFGSMVSVLKKSLAQALVTYYALAGEKVHNTLGEPELLCNNRGVDFVEAYADVELCDLNLYNPDDSVEGKLVPIKKQGVLSVQVTELRCGGLVVACTYDHQVADAYSANMFLVSWAEIAQSKPISQRPTLRRSLLTPRHPGIYSSSTDDLYVPISDIPPPKTTTHYQLISRIYYINLGQLETLQTLANDSSNVVGKKKLSKLETFSAFLWQLVADGVVGSEKNCKMGIVVDGRMRLSDDSTKKMENYFGNVLSIPYGTEKVRDLKEKPLSWVADAVHKFLDSAVTKDHFLELIDWVEAHRPKPAMTKIYTTAGASGDDDGPAFVVSSGQRFPVSKVDFGWGKPMFGSYHFPWGGETGYVMPMPSAVGNGDWIVYMHLFKRQLDLIEKQAGHVFKPLTFSYLDHQNQ